MSWTYRNTLQHTAAHCNALQHTAAHCNTLPHTATHRNTPQHTATHRDTLQKRGDANGRPALRLTACWRWSFLYGAVCCSVLQRVALYCSCTSPLGLRFGRCCMGFFVFLYYPFLSLRAPLGSFVHRITHRNGEILRELSSISFVKEHSSIFSISFFLCVLLLAHLCRGAHTERERY